MISNFPPGQMVSLELRPKVRFARLITRSCRGCQERKIFLALLASRCKFQSFGRQTENWRWLLSPERKPTLWLFSFAKQRCSPRHHRRFSELNGLYLAHVRIGSVIREQRPARATTRTTREIAAGLNPACGSKLHGWSSSPVPVNRLQATGEPRRVMTGGRTAKRLAPKNRTAPTCGKSQGRLSPSPKNRVLAAQFPALCPPCFFFPSMLFLTPLNRNETA